MRKFNIAMCIAWVVLTIAYIVLAIAKIDVPASTVAWLCSFYAMSFFAKIFDNTNKKEK